MSTKGEEDMQIGEEKEVTIEEFFTLSEQGGTYQIDTPDGWQDVSCLFKKRNKECYNLVLDGGQELGCSSDHYVLVDREWKKAEDVNAQHDSVLTRNGLKQIAAKEYIGIKDTFDLHVNSNEHRYYSNDVVSHNTGKSMICDALASCYEMPLLRLDMGAIFNSLVGQSEGNMRECLQIAEAIAPAILWLDEIEKGIGNIQSSGDSGTTQRVFGTFLTWLQDKQSPVFVACTANNVDGLPPEFLRAGRFDEIFFLDLPNDDQRFEVISKLLHKKKREPKDFNIDEIVECTNHYTPVEIEKGINNALFVAYSDSKRKVTTADIVSEINKFSPLYNTKYEEIQEMRKWALGDKGSGGRAILASSVEDKSAAPRSTGLELDLTSN